MIKPAIVAVGYNRPDLMKRLLGSISTAYYASDDIPLIISIDESEMSYAVELVARSFDWTHGQKLIRRFPQRLGLRRHIVECGNLSEVYGAVIILEDDLYVSEGFYDYACQAQDKYAVDSRICGVSLYSYNHNPYTSYSFSPIKSGYDVFLGKMLVTWGQSWTEKQWKEFKTWYLIHENKLPMENSRIPDEVSSWSRSWGKYFVTFMEENDRYYIFPNTSLTTCFAALGEHSTNSDIITSAQAPLLYGHMTYRMGEYDCLPKYDSFFERIMDGLKIRGIDGGQICTDLNGMKHISFGKEYLLTTVAQKYQLVKTFGMCLRPIEANALKDIDGRGIFLYRIPDGVTNIPSNKKGPYQYKLNHARLRYEHMDMSWHILKYYFKCEFKAGILRRLKKTFRRRKE